MDPLSNMFRAVKKVAKPLTKTVIDTASIPVEAAKDVVTGETNTPDKVEDVIDDVEDTADGLGEAIDDLLGF